MNLKEQKDEEKLHNKAISIVNNYFEELKKIRSKKPAKKNQITLFYEIFKHGGIPKVITLSNKQLSRTTINNETKLLWQTIKNAIERDLKEFEESAIQAFVESFCSHYMYMIIKSKQKNEDNKHEKQFNKKKKTGGKKI